MTNMTYRIFDIGRQNETLLNEDHYNIFKVLEPYLKYSSPNSPDSGPPSIPGTINEIREGALWLDRSSDLENSELKNNIDSVTFIGFNKAENEELNN